MKTCVIIERERRQRRAAFTLVEVMFASGIFAIACLAGYSGIIQGFRIIQNTREDLRATQILQNKTEVVRLYTWDQLTNGGFVPLTFTNSFNPAGPNGSKGATYYGTVTFASAPFTESYAADLEMVTFRVNWTNFNVSHQRQFSTLVSHYGLQNYIYSQSK